MSYYVLSHVQIMQRDYNAKSTLKNNDRILIDTSSV